MPTSRTADRLAGPDDLRDASNPPEPDGGDRGGLVDDAADRALDRTARLLALLWLGACALSLALLPPEGDQGVAAAAAACCLAGAALVATGRWAGPTAAWGALAAPVGVLVAWGGVMLVAIRSGLDGPWPIQLVLTVMLAVTVALRHPLASLAIGGGAGLAVFAAAAAGRPGDAIGTPGFVLALQIAQAVLVAVAAAGGVLVLRRATHSLADAVASRDRWQRDALTAAAARARSDRVRRMLHDTALNTLEAVHHSGDRLSRREVRQRCAGDIATLSRAFDTGPLAEQTLDARLRASAAATRAQGHAVRYTVACDEAPPAEVVDAVCGAVEEALRNCVKHAPGSTVLIDGTVDARSVRVQVTDDGPGPAAPGSDTGRADVLVGGRSPSREDHLGVRESIVGRMAECGGAAVVRPRAGSGTQVDIRWPATPRDPGDVLMARGRTDVSPTDLPRVVTGLALALAGLVAAVSVLALLVSWPAWDSQPSAAAAVLLPTAWLGWLVRPVLTGPPGAAIGRWDVAASLAVYGLATVLAVQAAPLCVSAVDTQFLLAPALAVLAVTLVARTRPGVLVWSSAAVLATSAAAAWLWTPLAPACAVPWTAAITGTVILASAWILVAVLDRQSRATDQLRTDAVAARSAADAERLLADDRRRWARTTLQRCMDRLSAIASGAADPADPAVRDACGLQARQLRALLGVGSEALPLPAALREWLGRAGAAEADVITRGQLATLRPPPAALSAIRRVLSVVELGPGTRVSLFGWSGPCDEGLALHVAHAGGPVDLFDIDGADVETDDDGSATAIVAWTPDPVSAPPEPVGSVRPA